MLYFDMEEFTTFAVGTTSSRVWPWHTTMWTITRGYPHNHDLINEVEHSSTNGNNYATKNTVWIQSRMGHSIKKSIFAVNPSEYCLFHHYFQLPIDIIYIAIFTIPRNGIYFGGSSRLLILWLCRFILTEWSLPNLFYFWCTGITSVYKWTVIISIFVLFCKRHSKIEWVRLFQESGLIEARNTKNLLHTL